MKSRAGIFNGLRAELYHFLYNQYSFKYITHKYISNSNKIHGVEQKKNIW